MAPTVVAAMRRRPVLDRSIWACLSARAWAAAPRRASAARRVASASASSLWATLIWASRRRRSAATAAGSSAALRPKRCSARASNSRLMRLAHRSASA